MENLNVEVQFLLENVGVKQASQIMNQIREKTIRSIERRKLSSNYVDYYNQLKDKQLIKRVVALISIELEMFSYPDSPFVHMSIS